jgi:endogenous inhibitor of DNA gyrase (YacG/DUF329 family)
MSPEDRRSPKGGATRTVPCPTCGEECAFEPWNPWRPFCSERCRMVDLGGWASESYRIPAKPEDDAPESGEGDDPE